MRSSEKYASLGFARANDVRSGRGGHDSILADNEVLDAICCCHLDDDLCNFRGVVASITSNYQGDAFRATWNGGEDGLAEVLGVVLGNGQKRHARLTVVSFVLLEDSSALLTSCWKTFTLFPSCGVVQKRQKVKKCRKLQESEHTVV